MSSLNSEAAIVEEAENCWSISNRDDLHNKAAKDSEINICCICLENRIECVLSCFHAYCRDCIDDWKTRDPTCPLCREQEKAYGGFDLLTEPDR